MLPAPAKAGHKVTQTSSLGGDNLYVGLLFDLQHCVCEVISSILFSRAMCAGIQARVTPNRSALYDPQFRNEKETCYIQKSLSPGACSHNLPGGSSSLWPI